MRTGNHLLSSTLNAAVAMPANRFVSLELGIPTAGAAVYGVTALPAAAGELLTVTIMGTAIVESGAAIPAGSPVQTDGLGRAIPWSAGSCAGTIVPGQEATAAGKFVEIILAQAGQQTSSNKLDAPIVLYAGDSITRRGVEVATLLPVPGSSNTSLGFSISGYRTYERAELHSCYEMESIAVAGFTLAQVVAALLATDISKYAVVSIMAGSNNTPGGTAARAATDLALLETAIQYCWQQNKPVRICTILPQPSLSAGIQAWMLAYNSGIRALPNKYANVFVADAFAIFQDPVSAAVSPSTGALFDAIHPGKKYNYLFAKYAGAPSLQLALQYAGYQYVVGAKQLFDRAAYTELLTNTDFAVQTGGTDSTAGLLTVGAVPAGYRLLNTGCTDFKIYYPFYVPEAKRQRGMWITGRAYATGDTVTTGGGAYVCQLDHTASTFATELAALKWRRTWSGQYALQIEFTGNSADDAFDFRESSNLPGLPTDTFRGFCGIATEGSVELVKNMTITLDAYNSTTAEYPVARLVANNALFVGDGLTNAPLEERFEAMVATDKLSPFSGWAGGTLSSFLFRISASLSAAGTASIIIYNPSVRKY